MAQKKYVLDTGSGDEQQQPRAKKKPRISKKQLAQRKARRRIILIVLAALVLIAGLYGYLRWRSIPRDVPSTFVSEPGERKPIQVSDKVKINASGRVDYHKWAGDWQLQVVAAEATRVNAATGDRRVAIPSNERRLFWTTVKDDGTFYFRGLPNEKLYFFAFYDRNGNTIANGVEETDSLSSYSGNPVSPEDRKNMRLELNEAITIKFYPGKQPQVVNFNQIAIMGEVTCDICKTGDQYVVAFTGMDKSGKPDMEKSFFVTAVSRVGKYSIFGVSRNERVFIYAFWDKNGNGINAGFEPEIDKIVQYEDNPVRVVESDIREGVNINIF